MTLLRGIFLFVTISFLFCSGIILVYPVQISAVSGISLDRLQKFHQLATVAVLAGIPLLGLLSWVTLSQLWEFTQRNKVLSEMVDTMGGKSKDINNAVKRALKSAQGLNIDEFARELNEAYILQGSIQAELTRAENQALPKFNDLLGQLQTVSIDQIQLDERQKKLEGGRQAVVDSFYAVKRTIRTLRERAEELGMITVKGYDGRDKRISLEDAVKQAESDLKGVASTLDNYAEIETKLRKSEAQLSEVRSRIPQSSRV